MVHTGIFATSSEILTKAGENYDTSVTEAKINELCLQAESHINCETHYNWSDAYAGLNADVKYLLSEAESNLVAIYIISYNLAGFSSRVEAETMLDVLTDRYQACVTLLKDQEIKTFMEDA